MYLVVFESKYRDNRRLYFIHHKYFIQPTVKLEDTYIHMYVHTYIHRSARSQLCVLSYSLHKKSSSPMSSLDAANEAIKELIWKATQDSWTYRYYRNSSLEFTATMLNTRLPGNKTRHKSCSPDTSKWCRLSWNISFVDYKKNILITNCADTLLSWKCDLRRSWRFCTSLAPIPALTTLLCVNKVLVIASPGAGVVLVMEPFLQSFVEAPCK
jgi:hypothetical protein